MSRTGSSTGIGTGQPPPQGRYPSKKAGPACEQNRMAVPRPWPLHEEQSPPEADEAQSTELGILWC